MRKSIKAFLFSFLIFPGTGHFALGLYRRGLLFLLPALLSMTLMLRDTMEQAGTLAEQILQGSNPQITETSNLQYASIIFTICWIVAIVDATRLGIKADQSSAAK